MMVDLAVADENDASAILISCIIDAVPCGISRSMGLPFR